MVDFPPDDLEWLSHKDMRIGEYYDLRKQAIRKFIDKLRNITPCTTEDGEKKSSSNNLPAHSVCRKHSVDFLRKARNNNGRKQDPGCRV
jgi:hypothetical protein